MRTRKWFNVALYALIGILLVVFGGSIIYIVRAGGGSLPVTGQAPNSAGTNVNGKTVTMNALTGKIRLVTFFYTHCPDICPLTAYQLEQVQNQLVQLRTFGTKVAIVSIDMDPEHDSLSTIRQWSRHFHANYSGWYFLRANLKQTNQILSAWGVQKQSVPGTLYLSHTVKTVLVDQNGNIRKTYNTANLNPSEIVSDVNGIIARSNW